MDDIPRTSYLGNQDSAASLNVFPQSINALNDLEGFCKSTLGFRLWLGWEGFWYADRHTWQPCSGRPGISPSRQSAIGVPPLHPLPRTINRDKPVLFRFGRCCFRRIRTETSVNATMRDSRVAVDGGILDPQSIVQR